MNLYLIGYRGCGKSTVAPILAKRLNWTVVDSDRQIELVSKKSIADIFANDGESAFRDFESSVILDIANLRHQIVALGGGAPVAQSNREIIARSGRVAWLNADPEILWKRIQGDPSSLETRPSLTELDGIAEVRQVMAERHSVYTACADYTINTDRLSPNEIADLIAKWWNTVDN